MPLSKNKSLRIIVPVAIIMLILNALLPINAYRVLSLSYAQSNHSRLTIDKATSVLLSMVDAETGMRGYIITSNQQFLGPYYSARAKLDSQRYELKQLTNDRAVTAKAFDNLENKTNASLEQIQKVIAVNEGGDNKLAVTMVRSGEGKARMDLVRSSVAELIELEKEELKNHAAYESQVNLYTLLALILLTVLDIITFVIAFKLLFKALRVAKNTENELSRLHRLSLKQSEQLIASNKIKDTQARLTDQLQSVISPVEAYTAIERFCTYLFPNYSGTLFIRSNSKDYFQLMARWGKTVYKDDGFEPVECWAARSNHMHTYVADSETIPCHHLSHSSPQPRSSVCIPISSSDEMIGIMTLYGEVNPGEVNPDEVNEGEVTDDVTTHAIDEQSILLANEVVAQIALAISNLRLRENLRKSSIVDVLTGLYNRRYLDETFIREIARSERAKESIGIIMLDIDHFKSFNDTYGHEAGDHVLHEVGVVLKQACRASDLACRYGGEEFVMLLLNADLKTTLDRTALIQEEIKKKHIIYGGQSLPPVTVSMGVSLYPTHGIKPEELIRCADEALYLAKHNGRDRTEIASGS